MNGQNFYPWLWSFNCFRIYCMKMNFSPKTMKRLETRPLSNARSTCLWFSPATSWNSVIPIILSHYDFVKLQMPLMWSSLRLTSASEARRMKRCRFAGRILLHTRGTFIDYSIIIHLFTSAPEFLISTWRTVKIRLNTAATLCWITRFSTKKYRNRWWQWALSWLNLWSSKLCWHFQRYLLPDASSWLCHNCSGSWRDESRPNGGSADVGWSCGQRQGRGHQLFNKFLIKFYSFQNAGYDEKFTDNFMRKFSANLNKFHNVNFVLCSAYAITANLDFN